ncbi:MAG: hypothetical protein OWS74_04055, partial [Firmicutes bacterium]|nr:hypothetical protein [Bacillota bacterium]
ADQAAKSIQGWKSLRMTIDETRTVSGKKSAMTYTLSAQTAPALSAILTWVNKQQVTEISLLPTQTQEYQEAANADIVMPTPSSASALGILMPTQLPAVLKGAKISDARFAKKHVVDWKWTAKLANGKQATWHLWYNLSTNTPIKWRVHWRGGLIEESASHVQINPYLSASSFHFVPPADVKLTVPVSNPVTDLLTVSPAPLHFTLILPPASVSLTLKTVNVSLPSSGHDAVLMTEETNNGHLLIVTEQGDRHGKVALPSQETATETVGSLTVSYGTLSSNVEIASFRQAHTLVTVEGDLNAVDNMLNQWSTVLVSVPSAAP